MGVMEAQMVPMQPAPRVILEPADFSGRWSCVALADAGRGEETTIVADLADLWSRLWPEVQNRILSGTVERENRAGGGGASVSRLAPGPLWALILSVSS